MELIFRGIKTYPHDGGNNFCSNLSLDIKFFLINHECFIYEKVQKMKTYVITRVRMLYSEKNAIMVSIVVTNTR